MADAVNARRIGVLDRASLERAADWLAVAVVVTMPWFQSIFQILIVIWLIVLIPTLDVASVRRELERPAGALPVLLWLFALVGMLWADIPWSERIAGLNVFHKLLIIPLLLAQFRRSARGWMLLYGFLASCVALFVLSTFSWALHYQISGRSLGIPVRDYIAQSSEFLICMFGMLAIALDNARARRWTYAAAAALLALLFLTNILAIATGRTALIVIPVLLLLLGFRIYGWKGLAAALLAGGLIAATAWATSPFLRERITRSMIEVQDYQTKDDSGSTGIRFELWRKASAFVASAPLVGHGTGSIPDLYRRAASGQGTAALATGNPHNQILAVAIQLGALGVAILMTMWIAHLSLFRGAGLISWIGIVIVLQNIVSSLFNSHLFDSFHGWLYVFAFGVVGGMAQRAAESRKTVAQ
jgi:O-antigen ligase